MTRGRTGDGPYVVRVFRDNIEIATHREGNNTLLESKKVARAELAGHADKTNPQRYVSTVTDRFSAVRATFLIDRRGFTRLQRRHAPVAK